MNEPYVTSRVARIVRILNFENFEIPLTSKAQNASVAAAEAKLGSEEEIMTNVAYTRGHCNILLLFCVG